MKNKLFLKIFFSLLIGTYVLAQNNDECAQNLSIFAENAKVKNYSAAYEPWFSVKNECPDLNIAIYAYGERILKDRIKNTPESEKIQRQTDLMNLYDDWVKFFPLKKGKSDVGNILSAKAQSMIDFKMGSNTDIYSFFDDALKKDPESFSNPKDFTVILKHFMKYINPVTEKYLQKNCSKNMKMFLTSLKLKASRSQKT